MDEILISIIIPVFNCEKYLEKCLNSIIGQNFENFEVICVDDGSTDSSLDILHTFENKFDNLTVLKQKNSGAAAARNLGIKHSKGKYILFVDSDDFIEKDTLKMLYENSVSNDSDIVLFNSDEFDEKGHVRDRIYFPVDLKKDYNNYTFNYKNNKRIVFNIFLVCWSKFYKKSFLINNNITFHNKKIFNDVQIHVETMIFAEKISYLPEILYHYRKENKTSLQSSTGKTNTSIILFNIFEELYEFLRENNVYSEIETEFTVFVIKESKNRFDVINENVKEEFFITMKKFLAKMCFKNSIIKKIREDWYKFYIHTLVSNSYFEFLYLESPKVPINENKVLLDLLQEKNKVIAENEKRINDYEYYKNILLNMSKFFENKNFITQENYDEIIDKGLFDYDFYINEYNYNLEIDPFIHYLFQGYLENKNPSEMFDGNYYKKFNKNVKDENPLLYFVNKGLKEGQVKINKNIHQPPSANRLELDRKLENFDEKCVNDINSSPQLIISLTTYADRIESVKYALYSLFNQSLKADKVILWLSEEDFPNKELDLPKSLLSLQKNGLTIKWCDNLLAYKKLIPALQEYPNDIIVTADDDLYYPKDWLEKMYENHLENPNSVIVHRARYIEFTDNNEIKPYLAMKIVENNRKPAYRNLFTGGAGALYPPKSLHEDISKQDIYNTLCPTGDDLWFWAMTVLNETKIKVVPDGFTLLQYVLPEESVLFNNSLWTVNQYKNDEQIKNIVKYYPKIIELLKEEI